MATKKEQDARLIFGDTKINITTEGKRHLGAALGSTAFKEQYVSDKVEEWCEELEILSTVAQTEPHAAYTAFVSGFRHKLTYTMRTIPGISHLLKKFDDILNTKFIPALTGGVTPNETERKLISIPAKFGGLGIPIFQNLSDIEYTNSREITKNLTDRIINQERLYERDNNQRKKAMIKKARLESTKSTIVEVEAHLSNQQKVLLSLNQEAGSSTSSTIPLESENFYLNKSSFRDLIRYQCTSGALFMSLFCIIRTTIPFCFHHTGHTKQQDHNTGVTGVLRCGFYPITVSVIRSVLHCNG